LFQSINPLVMGILNVTPDSFSDGGQFASVNAAVDHANVMLKQGADWVDVGGESTRPGSVGISVEEEISRTIPVIKRLQGFNISIDTSKPSVARLALESGAQMVNDVSGLRDDAMLDLVVEKQCQVCLMDMKGTPQNMQSDVSSDDVVGDVLARMSQSLKRAEHRGLKKSNVLLDVGIGFGKSAEQNFELIENMSQFKQLGCRILLGVSRKSFLQLATGANRASERDSVSAALVALLVRENVVDVFRVHQVKQTKEAIALAQLLTVK
jgi:dihydropteroate synthase